jgi:hypothetical protein
MSPATTLKTYVVLVLYNLASDETSRFTQGSTRDQKIRNVKIRERFKDELITKYDSINVIQE